MNNNPIGSKNENRLNLESNIGIASRILSGSPIDEWLFWGGDSKDRNLPLFCHLSRLLCVGKRGIAATGTLPLDSATGKAKAKTIVASTNPHKSNQKDAKSEWKFKDLKANGDLSVTDIKDRE
jgi:hypothetical protein